MILFRLASWPKAIMSIVVRALGNLTEESLGQLAKKPLANFSPAANKRSALSRDAHLLKTDITLLMLTLSGRVILVKAVLLKAAFPKVTGVVLGHVISVREEQSLNAWTPIERLDEATADKSKVVRLVLLAKIFSPTVVRVAGAL